MLKVPEVAAILRVCNHTVYRLVKREQLRKVPGLRTIRITEEAVHEYMNGKAA